MKKLMIPIFGILIIAIIGISTMAFDSVSADRTATINVVGDADGLIGLADTSDYATITGGKLVIDFSAISATGVNADATTVISNVFSITNNGPSTVTVTLAKTGTNASAIDFGDIETTGVQLLSGASTNVSMTIDSSTLSSGAQIISSITITATA